MLSGTRTDLGKTTSPSIDVDRYNKLRNNINNLN